MGFREKVVAHAESYWWQPCPDGVVWLKDRAVNIAAEASQRHLKNYGGAFLWYSPFKYEGLFLLPTSQINEARCSDASFGDFPSAVMLASYSDNLSSESEAQTWLKKNLRTLPPYHGLNDCTHFTSDCLVTGGFPVTDVHARRGAPELYRYLLGHHSAKVLASEVSQEIATVAMDKLMKPGDVIVYTDKTTRERHHAVIYTGLNEKKNRTIAMHTWHQHKVPWQTGGGESSQVYSLFHISLDDSFVSPAASRWQGWWRIAYASQQFYMFLDGRGHVAVTPSAPASLSAGPHGANYWFADSAKMWTCVRLKGLIDEYTMDPRDPTKATGIPLNGGAPITAQKLSK